MINFDIDKVLRDLDGKFNVTHLIVNRVKKLKAGIEPKVGRKMREKEIILAIRELDSGDLEYNMDEEAAIQREVELADTLIGEETSK